MKMLAALLLAIASNGVMANTQTTFGTESFDQRFLLESNHYKNIAANVSTQTSEGGHFSVICFNQVTSNNPLDEDLSSLAARSHETETKLKVTVTKGDVKNEADQKIPAQSWWLSDTHTDSVQFFVSPDAVRNIQVTFTNSSEDKDFIVACNLTALSPPL